MLISQSKLRKKNEWKSGNAFMHNVKVQIQTTNECPCTNLSAPSFFLQVMFGWWKKDRMRMSERINDTMHFKSYKQYNLVF